MKFTVYFFLACLALSQPAQAGECTVKISQGKSRLTWTGYKFTEKLAVSGTFDNIQFDQKNDAKSLEELLKSIQFTVDTASINSENPIRDKKLALYIFGHLDNPGSITGRVTQFDLNAGKAAAELKINGNTIKVPFKVEELNKPPRALKFVGDIDLVEIGLKKSHEQIAQACKELHTGSDGKAVTWSTVTLTVDTQYENVCH